MAAWPEKFTVVPDEDMCYSCFATTKYSCIKCGHSVCNRCSVFKDDEGTPGWVAGKSWDIASLVRRKKEPVQTTDKKRKQTADKE